MVSLVRGDLQIAFINGPQVPRRRMEGLIGRASRLDQSKRSRRTRGLRCRGGGNFGPCYQRPKVACFPPKISDRHPPQSPVMGSRNPRLSDLSVSWPVTPQKPVAGSAWRGSCGPLMKAICRSPRGSTNQSAPFITDSNSSARPLQLTAEWTAWRLHACEGCDFELFGDLTPCSVFTVCSVEWFDQRTGLQRSFFGGVSNCSPLWRTTHCQPRSGLCDPMGLVAFGVSCIEGVFLFSVGSEKKLYMNVPLLWRRFSV